MTPPARPGGWPPPAEAQLAGQRIDLAALAAEVGRRYFARYPEDLERYGEAGREWEQHDTQHLLNWAVGDVEGFVELERQVSWLAGVLQARRFPLEHLAVNLELAADVVASRVPGGAPVAARLLAAAGSVRAFDAA